MSKYVVIGSLNMDLVIESPSFPRVGETLLGKGFMTNPGGKGANQAVAMARLGVEVTMAGCVGQDSFGRELLTNLAHHHINIESILKTTEQPTGVAVIVVSHSNNFIIVNPGANFELKPEHLESISGLIVEADWCVLQMEIPLPAIEQAIHLAHQNNTKILFNPAPAKVIAGALYPLIHTFTPNETECQILSGLTIDNIESAKKAVDFFEHKGVNQVVITLGEKGVVYNQGEKRFHKPAYRVNAVDTTAAGDTFSGALAVGLSEKNNIHQAVDFALAASAISVTRRGAQASMPGREEVMRFLKEKSK